MKEYKNIWVQKALSTILPWAILLFGTSELLAKSCPPESLDPKPIVIGFAGWTLPLTSYHGSAIEQIIDRMRARTASAEVHPPDDWPDVTERLAHRGNLDGPIVLLGFSMGAAAAIHVAQRLGSIGIPVSKIVIVEAWNPEPIPANVGEATHFYSTRFAGLIRPDLGSNTIVTNIDLNGQVPGIENASHVAMSKMAIVQDMIIDKTGIDEYAPQGDHKKTAKGRTGCIDPIKTPLRKARPASKP